MRKLLLIVVYLSTPSQGSYSNHFLQALCILPKHCIFHLFAVSDDDNNSKAEDEDDAELLRQFKCLPKGIKEDVTPAIMETGRCLGEMVTAADHSQLALLKAATCKSQKNNGNYK